jgi:hypothetical protein
LPKFPAFFSARMRKMADKQTVAAFEGEVQVFCFV